MAKYLQHVTMKRVVQNAAQRAARLRNYSSAAHELRVFVQRVSIAACVSWLVNPYILAAQQDSRVTALLPFRTQDSRLLEMQSSLQDELQERLSEHGSPGTTLAVPTPLADMVLVLGCADENVACFQKIAEHLDCDEVVAASVEHLGDTVVLSITHFEMPDALTRAIRSRAKESVNRLVQEDVDAMMREIFDVARPEEVAAQATSTANAEERPDLREGQRDHIADDAMTWLPWVFVGGGVALVGGGLVAGMLSSSSESAYLAAPTETTEDVDRALAVRDRANTEATIANVLFVAGGLVVVTGVALLVFDAVSEDAEQEARASEVSVQPVLGSSGAGLIVGGAFSL